MANNVDVLLFVKCKAKWFYTLNKTNKNLSCIENKSNEKQASLCKLCTKSDNDITNIPPRALPTGPNLPSQSLPTAPTDVLRISRLPYSSMSSFHEDIEGLVHSFNMKTPIENFNLVSLEEYVESNSLNFSHLDSGKYNIFSCDQSNGDTFKGLILKVNSLKSLLCVHNYGWVDD